MERQLTKGVLACTKCGGKDIYTSYHTSEYGTHGCLYGSHSKRDSPHLHKYCRTCSYDWCEDTVKVKSRRGK
jgi:hypothetical protein